MDKNHQRLIWLIGAIVVILGSGIFSFRYFGANPSDRATIATVNGELISLREFRRVFNGKRAEVFGYFHQKYSAEDNPKFWTTGYAGEVPIEMAMNQTLEELKKIKVQQILAKQKGIIDDIGYSAFLKDLQNENARRKHAIQNHQVIYGPVHYGENEYFSYVFNKMQIKLLQKLREVEAVNEKELEDFYKSIKDRLYKREDFVKVQKITVSWTNDQGYADPSNRTKAWDVIERVKVRLDKGEPVEGIVAAFRGDALLKISYSEQIFDESSARNDYETCPRLKIEAGKLRVRQQNSGIIDDNAAFTVMRCIEKRAMGYQSFDEVRDHVKTKYIEQKYFNQVDELLRKAKVKVNHHVYHKFVNLNS